MSPIQQMLLGVGAVATKSYIDDCFSTYLYRGNGTSNHSILNGIDLAGEGGLVWTKNRDGSVYGHNIFDTERGVGKQLKTNTGSSESTESNTLTTFLSNGFKLNSDNNVNKSGDDFVSWSFRKSPAFTICEWTGNGTAGRSVSHDLGSVPGLIIIKCTSDYSSWMVWHRDFGPTDYLSLNQTQQKYADEGKFGGFASGSSMPTSTAFTLGVSGDVNGSSKTYVAYVFAGGESTAATARSVDFDGVGDYLSFAASSDFQLGTGDFTVEGWFKYDGLGNTPCIFDFRSTTGSVTDGFAAFVKSSTGKLGLYTAGGWICDDGVAQFENQWYHFAAVKSSGTIKLYINGTQSGSSYTTSTDFTNNTLKIGSGATGANQMQGWISNLRVVKGTAVYTSSFRPPTEPLTNITNTKLLCCNNSSTTGSTVTPGTITANGDPTASTDSPLDDPAGFVFGDAGDQNVIKCGSYVENGSSTGPEFFLGWEPQLIILKESSNSGNNWSIWDSMRGITTGGSDALLEPNDNSSEWNGANYLAVTPTGFKLESDSNNGDGRTMVYMAIRRPDGYVGKPPELGTDVFAMDTGNSSSNGPAFDSNFAVDFTFSKEPSSTGYWITTARLINKWLRLNDTDAEASLSSYERYDLSKGVHQQYSSSNQAFMFKRHAGFDVVTYKGNGVDRYISHSMNQSPEMMWFKKRNSSKNWYVYHSGLDGGNSPEDYSLRLNTTALEDEDGNTLWNQTVPTATHFRINTDSGVNADGDDYLALLFSSVSGISKVGRYTGNGSDTGPIITTGFAPRFLIIRRAGPTEGDNWNVYDTIRGFSSGSDPLLKINNTNAQLTGYDIVDPTSDGFQLATTDSAHNSNNVNYVYYAHA